MTSGKTARKTWDTENIGILAYGSLLADPGPDIGPRIIERIQQQTPWPVEYARRSESRGGAPTLVIHPKGSRVQGAVLVLDLKRNEEALAREWLRIREGRTSQENIKSMELSGLKVVLYADLPGTIPDEELSPECLADYALASVSSLLERNGIAYLADNIQNGVKTPLTDAYSSAILRKTGAPDLQAAIKTAAGLAEEGQE